MMIAAESEKKILIGRKQELMDMLEAFRAGKHILLLGAAGAGKTALIEAFSREIKSTSPQQEILICQTSTGFKDACLQLLGQLWSLGFLRKIPNSLVNVIPHDDKVQKYFSELSVTVLKNLILTNVKDRHLIFVFDNLPKLKLRFYLFLDNLRDHAQLIIIPENGTKRAMGRLWMLNWGFEEIEVGKLSLEESKQLASLWIQDASIAGDKEFIKRLAQISEGNPKRLKKMCDQAQKQIAQQRGKVDAVLASVDSRIEDFLKKREQ